MNIAAANTNTIQQVLLEAKEKLHAIADNTALEAEMLLMDILSQPRSYLYTETKQLLTIEQLNQFNMSIARRRQGEPIAYITGKKEFWSLMLTVTPDVLIPRPETELLVETALNIASATKQSSIKIADLGTGTGAIALALASECPIWQLTATDKNGSALQVARKNAQDLEINNISFYEGNWCTALPHSDFDMVISNPPYIALTEWEVYASGLVYEPSTALVSGQDGLDAIREISSQARHYIKPGGYLLIEHGFLQGSAVREIFRQDGYEGIRTVRDLAGHERLTIAVKAGPTVYVG